MDCIATQTREWLDGEEPLELSFVELILAASECSEDETEVGDLVDAVLASGRVRLEGNATGPRPVATSAPARGSARAEPRGEA